MCIRDRVESALDWDARISRAARAFTHYREDEAPLEHGGRDVISFTSLAPDHNTFAVQAFRKVMNDVLEADDLSLIHISNSCTVLDIRPSGAQQWNI